MKRYWFKRKQYGWGWTPSSREGWFIMGIYIVFTLGYLFILHRSLQLEEATFLYVFYPVFLFATAVLVVVCYLTGEKPKWQWGPPKKNLDNKRTKK